MSSQGITLVNDRVRAALRLGTLAGRFRYPVGPNDLEKSSLATTVVVPGFLQATLMSRVLTEHFGSSVPVLRVAVVRPTRPTTQT